MGDYSLRKEKGCAHVDVEKGLEVFKADVGNSPCATDCSVVYEDVEATERHQCLLY